MNTSAQYVVDFANFCTNYQLPPETVMKLVQLGNKIGEKETKATGEQLPESEQNILDFAYMSFEKEASNLSPTKTVTVEYNGLYPSLIIDGQTVFLPYFA